MTKNFKIEEFYCKDGTSIPEHLTARVRELANNLQVLRDVVGKPIIINSAYRHPKYNESIGGASKSQHLTASAADIRVNGVTPKELYNLIESLISSGQMTEGGLGLYNSFVHYDIRGYKSRFNFTK